MARFFHLYPCLPVPACQSVVFRGGHMLEITASPAPRPSPHLLGGKLLKKEEKKAWNVKENEEIGIWKVTG